MDKKLFEQRLAELIDYQQVTPKVLREERMESDDTQQVLYEGQPIEIDRLSNPTLGIELKQLKPQVQACELGCGRMVNRQVINRSYHTHPEPHWRVKCATCGDYQHPDGSIIHNQGVAVANEFARYYRERSRQKIMQSRPRS